MASIDFSKIRLTTGLSMKLEVEGGDSKRHNVNLIGYIPGRTVLITTPLLGEHRPLLLRKEQGVIVRFFSNKSACAFRTQVAHICTTPAYYLHLTWPDRVEAGEIRKAERVLANLQVTIVNQSSTTGERGTGAIVDLSTTGARLETLQALGKPGDILLMTSKVSVGHVTRVISIEAVIRAVLDRKELSNSAAAYGIEFKYVSDIDFLALQAFVNAQMARGAER
ncbi:flagellar brake protein [Saccharospirillum mangrovi]|uniref:flagellar brake protein n=1 Tax=Saccharospirillum mangrovi TaxID=2161747 RepID=UPI000D3B6198|nr:flagellar brake protein [Saccharospirillum mangrovi]